MTYTGNRKTVSFEKEIVIDELEAAMVNYNPPGRPWSEADNAILRKYYGKVPIAKLARYLKRGTSATSKKAQDLGLTGHASE